MRFAKRLGGLALAGGLGITCVAQAADDNWYVVAFGGETSGKNISQGTLDQQLIDTFAFVGLSVVDATSTLDDSDTGFGAAVGYQVNENFAAELSYVELGDIDYRASGTVTDGFSDMSSEFALGQSASGPVFSLLGIWPVGSRFSVFGRAGIALIDVDADIRLAIDDAEAADSASTQRSNLVYGVGAEYALGSRIGLRLEWDRYAEVGSEELTGDIDIDHVSLGVRYSFD